MPCWWQPSFWYANVGKRATSHLKYLCLPLWLPPRGEVIRLPVPNEPALGSEHEWLRLVVLAGLDVRIPAGGEVPRAPAPHAHAALRLIDVVREQFAAKGDANLVVAPTVVPLREELFKANREHRAPEDEQFLHVLAQLRVAVREHGDEHRHHDQRDPGEADKDARCELWVILHNWTEADIWAEDPFPKRRDRPHKGTHYHIIRHVGSPGGAYAQGHRGADEDYEVDHQEGDHVNGDDDVDREGQGARGLEKLEIPQGEHDEQQPPHSRDAMPPKGVVGALLH